jgi:hypothetical protein
VSVSADFQVDSTDNVFYVDSVTNMVGIGTAGPDAKLDIRNNSSGDLQYSLQLDRVDNTNYEAVLNWATNNSMQWWFGMDNDSTDNLHLGRSGPTYVQTWLTNGNVGIGDSSPDYTLSIDGTASISDDFYVGNTLLFVDISASGVSVSGDFQVDPDDNVFYVDSNNNRVGIGDLDPSYTLSVDGTASISDDFYVGDDALYIDASAGEVGMGTTALGEIRLEVDGSASISQEFIVANQVQFAGGGEATVSYSRFGSDTTSQGLSSSDDVLFSGEVEHNATVSFDQGASFSENVWYDVEPITYAATINIDWGQGTIQHVSLIGSPTTINLTGGKPGGKYILILKQDTLTRTVIWGPMVRWSGTTAPDLTDADNKTDYIGFIYNDIDAKYDGVAERLNF